MNRIKNKELALKLGLPWSTMEGWYGHFEKNPDFTTPDGIHLLLREMKKRPDWNKFLDFISVKYCSTHYATLEEAFELILEPGKLRDAAIEFLGRKQ